MTKLSKTFHKIFSPSRRRGEKGFTLIELLVVVGILGVLAGVVTLSVGQFIGTGTAEAAVTELHNVQTAVTAYQADNSGVLPSGINTDLDTYFVGGVAALSYNYTLDTGGVVSQGAKK